MSAATVDAITLELIHNSLVAIVDEMEANLARTAYSEMIYEVRDYCAALVDEDGAAIAQARGSLALFLADLGIVVSDAVATYGRDGFRPGDVLITNDPDVCGQHLNNVVVFTPVFSEGELFAFAAVRAHWTDIGGRVPGSLSSSSTEIFQEGLQIPTVKLYDQGVLNDEILRMIAKNVRLPDQVLGDLRAQLGACRLGEERLGRLIDKYGGSTMREAIDEIWSQSEALSRQRISELPDGEYFADSFLDDDGINVGEPVHIKVRVVVLGDELLVDFSDASPQVKGPINCGHSGTMAAAKIAFKCLTTPVRPADQGAFRPLSVVVPEGTFLNAKRPAALAYYGLTIITVVDTIFKALAPALPNQTPAGSRDDFGATVTSGIDPDRDKRFIFMGGSVTGGWGARPWEDGPCGMLTLVHGDTYTASMEVDELAFPVLFEAYKLRENSGGAGRYRGGLGTVKQYRVLTDCNFASAIERNKCVPWGLAGGKAGKGSHASLVHPDGTEEIVTKVTGKPIAAGTIVGRHMAGGGGWGDPTTREASAVLQDVVRGYISIESAKMDYGVVIEPKSLNLNEAATAELRTRMRP
ncbi:MAG: N-methylhydantoinase [Actinomycetota bacterium]|jgi:N-methylhydantoinase B|nr:N-methylhydantoinase [Actinomycetota bacterium]